jgi:glycosyltransferase involved in cell wall biosynthesis
MKVLLFANTDWYLYNFRFALARAIEESHASVVLVSPGGPYGNRLVDAGFRWFPIAMDRRSLNPFAEVGVIRSIRNLYRREQPDLVHHFTLKPVVYGSLAARMASVPFVVNAPAGLGFVFSSRAPLARALRPVVAEFLRLALRARPGRLIVQNPDDGELLTRSALADESCVRLIRGSGVDTTRFRPRRRAASACPTVLLATRLLWKKGIGEYANAARLLRSGGVSARFLLAGAADDGNPDGVPHSVIRQWCDEGVLEWLGHVEDMADLLGQVDVVALPTSYGEGVPRVLLEAAAAGLPLVATSAPGCREIVEHDLNGLLVPPGDADALAGALRRLIDSPGLRELMGHRGRRKVLLEFDEQIVNRKTIEVYRELLPGRFGADTIAVPSHDENARQGLTGTESFG